MFAVVSRLVTVPLQVAGIRTAARLRIHKDKSDKLISNIKAASLAYDSRAVAFARMERSDFVRRHKLTAGDLLAAPFVQMILAIGLFVALRRICDLPLAQLTESGFSYLPDLTLRTRVADPYAIIPITTAAVALFNTSKVGFPTAFQAVSIY